jgi:16S rRNA (guanine527-N7)-methyltransferase
VTGAPPDVSRETPEPTAAARTIFGARLPALVAYADLLATDGVERGLIGPREVPRLWDRHLVNCALVAELVPDNSAVTDVGSGAGLPGLVLALQRPDLRVNLLEPLLRRAQFLAEAVERLGLRDRVTVVRARAEEPAALHQAGSADVVAARAVAPLDRLLPWCLPLARPGGLVLAMKGAAAADELAVVTSRLGRLGGADPSIHRLGAGLVDPQTTVVRVVRTRPARQDRSPGRQRRSS